MKDKARELLNGSIDMHVHGFPDISLQVLNSMEDIENIRLAQSAGMRAVVLKSHVWSSIGSVYHLKDMFTDIDIFSSVTLNQTSGGVNGYVAEIAAKQGARVIWLPTWSARHDIQNQGFSLFMNKKINHLNLSTISNGISICNDNMDLTDGMIEVLEVANDYNIIISTGHISPIESLVLARECRNKKFNKLIFSHPIIPLVGASIENIREFVKLGGLVEFTFYPTLPHMQKVSLNRIAETIINIGPQNCILTSDYFNVGSPPVHEMLRMFIAGLLERNLSEDDIKIMLHTNPGRMLYE